MSSDLEQRLARRRRVLQQKQVRRRRAMLALICGVLLLAGGFMLLSGKENPTPAAAPADDSSRTAKAPEGQTGGRVPAGSQPGPDWQPHRGPVPILMYHVIGDPAGDVAYPDLYLSTGDFRDQVRRLKKDGYTAVTLSQVQDAWYEQATLPPKPVVLSFDDGYLGQLLYAMPILREVGWAGLLNLKAEGSDLSTRQVKKMIAAGWEIGSHTTTHPDLRNISGEALRSEVAGSKKKLERDLGVTVENFCYPAGMYDEEAMRAVEDAGYRGATTVNPGLGKRDMPFELNRIRIDRGDSADALIGKLSSAGA